MSLIELSIGTWRFTVERARPEPAELARMYDGSAWRWHSIVNALGYGRAYARLIAALERDGWLRDLHYGAKVLDGGIGSAALAAALADTVADAPEIHGIDLSPRMLAQARATLGRLRRPGPMAQLRYGDVNSLPFPDENFDMVMCAHLIEHSPAPSQTIDEMVRVLRAGAPLLMVTTRARRANALHGMHWRYRSIERTQLFHWMQRAGLNGIRGYALGGGLSLPGRLSEAYIGRKAPMREYAFAAGAFRLGEGMAPKFHETGLLRMQRQPELREPRR